MTADFNNDKQQSLLSLGKLEGNISVTNNTIGLSVVLNMKHRTQLQFFYRNGSAGFLVIEGSIDGITYYITKTYGPFDFNDTLALLNPLKNAFPFVRLREEPDVIGPAPLIVAVGSPHGGL